MFTKIATDIIVGVKNAVDDSVEKKKQECIHMYIANDSFLQKEKLSFDCQNHVSTWMSSSDPLAIA